MFSTSAVPIKRLIYAFFVGGFRCVWCEQLPQGAEGIVGVNRCSRLRVVLLALRQLLVVGEEFFDNLPIVFYEN